MSDQRIVNQIFVVVERSPAQPEPKQIPWRALYYLSVVLSFLVGLWLESGIAMVYGLVGAVCMYVEAFRR